MVVQVSCFNSVWREQTQGPPLLQPPITLQPFSQSQPSEPATHLSSIIRASQHHFLSLSPYYWSNMRFIRIIPHKWGPPSTFWSTCICRPPTPTSLWTSIFTKKMWVWRAWAIFSASWPRRMAKLPNCLLKMQNQCWDRVPFQNVQKPSQDEWGKNQDAMEATLLMEKNPSHALLDLCGPHRPPPLYLPGESLLGGAGETHQEDGWPPDQPPQAGRSSGWVKGISLGSTIRNLWSLADFEEPLWCQGFYMKPLSAASRQLFNPLEALSQALDQMQTIRLFADKNKVNEK